MQQIMSYKYPALNPQGISGNNEQWMTTPASNASTATRYSSNGNSSLLFTLASNSQFLRTHQCFLSFTLTPRDGNDDPLPGAGIVSSRQGVSRAFQRLTLRIGNVIIESFDYDDQMAMYLSTIPESRKKWLKIMEGFGDTNAFANGPRKFEMQIYSSLLTNPNHVPLPIFQGGLQLELEIATESNLFTSAVPRFTIDDPSLRWLAVVPDPSYTLALTSGIQSQRSAWIPMTLLRTFRSTGLGSTEMLINAAVGNVTSVDSVITTYWDTNKYNDRTNDRFDRFHDAGLRTWTIEGAGIQNPASRTFTHGVNDPETIMVTFLSESGSIHNVDQVANLDADFRTKNFRFGLNFQSDNEYHSSGLNLVGAANPNVVISTSHAASVTTNTVAYTTVAMSVVLEVTGSLVNVHRVFS